MPRTRTRIVESYLRADSSRRRWASESSDSADVSPKRRRSSSPSNPSRRLHTSGDNDKSGRKIAVNDKDFREKMAVLRVNVKKKEASQLKPHKANFHIEENRSSHNTDDYAMETLIVRRGQEFKLTLTFDRLFDAKKDTLILQLSFGSRPQESKQSLIRVKETNNLNTSSWGMRIDGTKGKDVTLTVMSPYDALVGEYAVYVETATKKSGSKEEHLTYRRKMTETFFVLFNAWCKDDVVYMENDAHRKEYVLNDHGRIWVGNSRNFSGIPWNFGQFEDVSLPCCLNLLDISKLGSSARGNATRVCRVISQMANENDEDGGVLEGRWTETYPKDSTAPTEWTGSVAILKQFSKKMKVVRYGQCWVFSGLVTTLLRAIGIPTRSVTNFESAHDNDASMTVDFHFDEDGEPIEELNDSIWNFHVWDESYFARPDLPPGYGGWQAHDATPQETSEGIFRCGPCPVKAIKEGEVYIPYDGGFIFGEVNGDRVYWEVKKDGEMEPSFVDKKSIGRFISTKRVGSNLREDLTMDYKYPEGSAEERRAVLQANKYSSRKDEEIYKKTTSSDIKFESKIDSESVNFGEDVNVQFLVKNTSKQKRTVEVHMVSKIAFYTGVTARNLEHKREIITVQGGNDQTVSLLIKADSYINKTAADACVKVFYKAKVQETQQAFNGIETVEFQKPDVMFTMPDEVRKDNNFEVIFSLRNHLPINFKNCVFNVETSRFVSPDTLKLRVKKPVKPNEEASSTAVLKSDRRGKRSIIVSFKCDQLSGARYEIEFDVSD